MKTKTLNVTKNKREKAHDFSRGMEALTKGWVD